MVTTTLLHSIHPNRLTTSFNIHGPNLLRHVQRSGFSSIHVVNKKKQTSILARTTTTCCARCCCCCCHQRNEPNYAWLAIRSTAKKNIYRNSVRQCIQRSLSTVTSNDLTVAEKHHDVDQSSDSAQTEKCSKSSNSSSSSNQQSAENSYLVIKFEESVYQKIHNAVVDIQSKLKEVVERPRQMIEHQYGSPDAMNQPLQIQARSIESIELILFSGGTALHTVPSTVLHPFYNELVDRLDRSGFTTTHGTLKEGNIAHPDDFWFRTNEIKIFPPTTKNLLVITLHTSVAWMCLYEDIQIIANKYPELPHRPLEKHQILRWLPLMVLGEIVGGTGRYMKEHVILNSIVSNMIKLKNVASNQQTITMGGIIPSQIPILDWNFYDTQRKRPVNEQELLNDMEDEFWKTPTQDAVNYPK